MSQLSGGLTNSPDAFVALGPPTISTGRSATDTSCKMVSPTGWLFNSQNYGAVTAVTISRGYSEIDEIYAGINTSVRNRSESMRIHTTNSTSLDLTRRSTPMP